MATWLIDPAHSEVGFKVKHLVVSTASGKFLSFEGRIEADKDDFSDAKISFSADVNSIHTGNEQRDGHLKSADFFNAEKFGTMTFVSTKVESIGGPEYQVTGNLTIKDVTEKIVLNVEFGGLEKSPYGHTVAGFEVTTKIDRQKYGLTWNAVTEAGGLVVGNDVKVVANIELIRQ
jgi:polyisoprenoid-binding protein YceI